MSNADTPDSLPNANDPDERLRDHLSDDDSTGTADSEEAILDADTIGSALHDGDAP